MLPQADSDVPTRRGEIQLLFTCQPADAREQQLIRQLRSLFQLAECYLAALIQISPDGARRTIDLCLHLSPRFTPRLDCRAVHDSSVNSASGCSSQNRMAISRYSIVAVFMT